VRPALTRALPLCAPALPLTGPSPSPASAASAPLPAASGSRAPLRIRLPVRSDCEGDASAPDADTSSASAGDPDETPTPAPSAPPPGERREAVFAMVTRGGARLPPLVHGTGQPLSPPLLPAVRPGAPPSSKALAPLCGATPVTGMPPSFVLPEQAAQLAAATFGPSLSATSVPAAAATNSPPRGTGSLNGARPVSALPYAPTVPTIATTSSVAVVPLRLSPPKRGNLPPIRASDPSTAAPVATGTNNGGGGTREHQGLPRGSEPGGSSGEPRRHDATAAQSLYQQQQQGRRGAEEAGVEAEADELEEDALLCCHCDDALDGGCGLVAAVWDLQLCASPSPPSPPPSPPPPASSRSPPPPLPSSPEPSSHRLEATPHTEAASPSSPSQANPSVAGPPQPPSLLAVRELVIAAPPDTPPWSDLVAPSPAASAGPGSPAWSATGAGSGGARAGMQQESPGSRSV